MAVSKNEKLIERFLLHRAFGLEYRAHFEQRWRNYWLGYMNKRPRPSIPNEYWTYKTRVADEFRIVETILPQHVLNMHKTQDWFSVYSPTSPGQMYEQMVKQLLVLGWRRSDQTIKLIEMMKYALICGSCIVKTFWDVQLGPKEVLMADEQDFEGNVMPQVVRREVREEIVYNGPQSYIVDLFNYVMDPTGEDKWAMERMTRSMEALKEKNRKYHGKFYDQAELKKAEEKNSQKHQARAVGPSGRTYSSGAWASGPYNTASAMEYVEGIEEQRYSDSVDLWEWWTWVPPDLHPYDDSQWRLITIINDEHVVRDVKAPTPDLKHPYLNIKAIPIPGRLYGESVLYWVEDLIDLRNWLEDARREEVVQKLWQPMLVDANVDLSPDDLFRRPGGMLWVSNFSGSLGESIIPVPQNDVFPSSYSEPAIKDEQISRISGATSPFEAQPAGGRTTATEISIITQLGSGRFQLATLWMDETFKRQQLKRMFQLYQSRLTQPEIIELVGRDQRQRFEIDLSALLWDVDIMVDTGSFGSMDQQMLQNYLQLYGIFAANPIANQYLNHGDIIRDAFRRAGDPKADVHVRSDDAVARENAALAQQEQQLQQQQVEQQAGLDVNRELARGLASAVGRGGGAPGEVGGVV